jgi:hypothetical protein
MNEKVVFVRETICDVMCIYRMPYDTRSKTLSRATKYEGVAHMLFSAQPVFVCVTCFVVSNVEKKDCWLVIRGVDMGGGGSFQHSSLALRKSYFNFTAEENTKDMTQCAAFKT